MMPGMRAFRTTPLVTFSLLFACSKINAGGGNGNSPDAGPIPSGAGYQEHCQTSTDCRIRLSCDNASKTCVPSASVIQGGACILSGECIAGCYCTQQGTCAPSGTATAGTSCSSEGDCAAGLVCVLTGLTGICQAPSPSARDISHSCDQTTGCLPGLLCVSGTCAKGDQSPWAGVACSSTQDSSTKIYFHVPRATDSTTSADFYRLPFPNDIRLKKGKVSLTGHPRPGPRILDFDPVDRYITAIEAESTGFGANQTMYLRFSKEVSAANFPLGCGVTLVDITPTSPTYGYTFDLACGVSNASARYICGPYMWVRTSLGSPLRPGTTYALLVGKAITDVSGSPFTADDDFTAMLDDVAPTDADLAAAYPAYSPLRNYIAAGKVAAADLASAAVFTVDKYEDPLAAIDTAIATAPAPKIENMVRCGDPGAVSPCDDGKTGADHLRGCLPADSASANYDTYQGTIALPVFQQGTPPYLTPTNGGNIVYDAVTGAATMLPLPQKVCFALTVPKGVAPASGWPLVVYSHGTGGSYHSIIDLGLSDDFAQGKSPAGLGLGVDGGASAASVPMATLGYDGILHGTRNGGSTASVGELVYNIFNPSAARDNALQAAADLLAIPHALPGFASAPQAIVLNGNRVALYGHSQGGNGASLVAARQSSYGAIVMSGTGGTLIYTLLEKTQPINIPAVLPYFLGEPGPAALDANHPVLNLMQMYFDRSDSVNFGRRLFLEPLDTMTPHHLLHVYGTKDSYSVVDTQRAYALAARFQVATATTMLDSFGLVPVVPPVSLNENFGTISRQLTAVEIQYQPTAAYDGHFVSTQNLSTRAAIQEMLVTFARDGIPTVSP